jgi:hypothetical protein
MAISYKEIISTVEQRTQDYVDGLEKKIDFQMKVRYFGGNFTFREFDNSFMTTTVLEELRKRYGGDNGWDVALSDLVLIFSKARPRSKCTFDDPLPDRFIPPGIRFQDDT